MENKEKKYISAAEVAKLLGVSRISIFKKIQKGVIKAHKVGRNYIIAEDEINHVLGLELTEEKKKEIEKSVEKTVKEYGETLRLLGKE